MSSVTISAPWIDGKRWLWLLSPALPLLAVIGLYLFHGTGFGLFAWSGPIILYGLIPLLDWLIGVDRNNPPESAVAGLENDFYYRVIVYLYIPFQYGLTVYGARLVATAHPSLLATIGLIFYRRHHQRHRHQHRARAGPQEGRAGALAGQDHPGAGGLRPLLRRAHPRPP